MIDTLVIAAGGRGSRMQAVQPDIPKHLTPINGKPFLQYILEAATRAGITKFVIVIGHQSDQIQSFLETTDYDYQLVDQFAVCGEDRYGTAVVVEAVEAAVRNAPFIFQAGDILFTEDAYAGLLQNDGLYRISGVKVADPQGYGILEMDDSGMLTRWEEKPEQPASDIANTSLYAFQPEIFALVKAAPLSERGEYELTDVMNNLAQQHKVAVHMPAGAYVHLSTPDDIAKAADFVTEYSL